MKNVVEIYGNLRQYEFLKSMTVITVLSTYVLTACHTQFTVQRMITLQGRVLFS